MAVIKAFRGIRYNLEKVLLKQVITPPYDVISPKMREMFFNRSPYNVVNIDLPIGDNDRYEKSADLYRSWLSDKVLIRDEQPSYYLYEQVYEFEGRQYTRSGFFGDIKLSAFGDGVVFPHEKTHSGPKIDRYELMKSSSANFSSVFGLYLDDSNKLNDIFIEVKKNVPDESALDDDKVKHSIWKISDKDFIEEITKFMLDKSIYIADGHHRYETAVIYRDDMRKQNNISSDVEKEYDFALMMFVNFLDIGLKVFPTHRVVDVDSSYNDEIFIKHLIDIFDITKLDNIPAMQKFLEDNKGNSGSWGFIGLDGVYSMSIKQAIFDNEHTIYRYVSTYLLEYNILKRELNFTDDMLSHKDGIHFIQTLDDIKEYMDANRSIAFILNPESLDVIRKVSEAGLVMPQKSTYFYPKLATGLIINELK